MARVRSFAAKLVVQAAKRLKSRPFGQVVAGAALPVLFAVLLIGGLYQAGLAGSLYNSDLVQPFMIAQDVLADAAALADWQMSPALYLFPDVVLAAAAEMTGSPNIWLPIIYGVISLSLYAVIGGYALTSAGLGNFGTTILAVAGTMSGLWALALTFGERSAWLVQLMPAPFIHNGAAQSAVLAAAVLLSQRKTMRMWLGLLLLVAVATVSDLLFLMWFGPAAFAIGLIGAVTQRRFRPAVEAASLVVLGATAAYVTNWLRDFNVSYITARRAPLESLSVFLNDVLQNAADLPFLAMLAVALLIIGRGAYLSIFVNAHAEPKTTLIYEVALAAALLFALIVPIATGLFYDPALWRYMMIVPFLECVWISAFILLHCPLRRVYVFITSMALLVYGPLTWANVPRLLKPTPLVQCLDAAGLTEGIGDYWTAKMVMFRTDRRIMIAQVTANGYPLRYNFNDRWFSIAPDFVVLDRLDQDQIRRRFGRPSHELTCGRSTIWRYAKPHSL